MTRSFERRRRDNGRVYRNFDPDKVAARDNDLAKIKSDKEAFKKCWLFKKRTVVQRFSIYCLETLDGGKEDL